MKTQNDRHGNSKGPQQGNARNPTGTTQPNPASKGPAPIVATGDKAAPKAAKDAEQAMKADKHRTDRAGQRPTAAQDKQS